MVDYKKISYYVKIFTFCNFKNFLIKSILLITFLFFIILDRTDRKMVGQSPMQLKLNKSIKLMISANKKYQSITKLLKSNRKFNLKVSIEMFAL